MTNPTRIYSYGCLRPLHGEEAMLEQLQLAHRFYNELTDVVRSSRVAAKAQLDLAQPPNPRRDELKARLEELKKALVEEKVTARKKSTPKTKAIRVEMGNLVAELKALPKAEATEEVKAIWASMYAGIKAGIKTKRQEYAAKGLYWGTYNAVIDDIQRAIEDTAHGSPKHQWWELPFPQRWTGEGKVKVQIMHGIPVDEVFACNNQQLQIQPIPPDTYTRKRHDRMRASRTEVALRVTSDEKSHPVWVILPVVLHRQIPADALIKEAWILRKKLALGYEYRLQLVTQSSMFLPDGQCGEGVVAVDLGWRREGPGRLRAAYWADDKGQHGEVLIPAKVYDGPGHGLGKCDDLESIRDKKFNEIKKEFGEWMKVHGDEWLRERCSTMTHWEEPARLAAVIRDWREHRFPGDEEILGRLESWAKDDRHLLRWHDHQRSRLIRHRDESYRIFAAALSRKYHTLILEDFDLTTRRIAQRVSDEIEGRSGDIGTRRRRNKAVGAPGTLRTALIDCFEKHGGVVNEEPCEFTTKDCHACHGRFDWDQEKELTHTCPGCGATWDQDYNACMNLLALHQNHTSDAVTSDESTTSDSPVLGLPE